MDWSFRPVPMQNASKLPDFREPAGYHDGIAETLESDVSFRHDVRGIWPAMHIFVRTQLGIIAARAIFILMAMK